MAWCYEIRGSENRVVEIRSGFATEKEAHEAGKRSKRMIDCICYPNLEKLTVVTKHHETVPGRTLGRPVLPPEADPSSVAQPEANLKYPWQQAVLDAFLEPHAENLQRKINVAECAISARLLESNPFELDERVALGEALLALHRLLREQSQSREEPREKKDIA
jgi:hypothetical protein